MFITPNYVYAFSFKTALSALDGIYRVSSIISYADMLLLNLDLYKLTYKPNTLSEDAFKADLNIIRSGKIAKLVSVNDENIIYYIPEHLFDKVPDGSVQKYFHLGLAVNLGIFDDAGLLNTLKAEIDQIIQTATGIANKTVIYSVKNTWMTTAAYKTIDDERNAKITRISNHYTDKLALIKEIDSLKTRIAYYEQLIKVHSI